MRAASSCPTSAPPARSPPAGGPTAPPARGAGPRRPAPETARGPLPSASANSSAAGRSSRPLRWWIVRIPISAAGVRLNGRSSTNTHSSRARADRLGPELVDPRGGLADPDLTGDHRCPRRARRAAAAGSCSSPTSSRSGRWRCRPPAPPHGVDHRLVESRAGEQARDEAVVALGDPEQAGQPRLEVPSSTRPSSKAMSSSPRLGGVRNACADRVAIEPLGLAEARRSRTGWSSSPRPSRRAARLGGPRTSAQPPPNVTASARLRELDDPLPERLQIGIVGRARMARL